MSHKVSIRLTAETILKIEAISDILGLKNRAHAVSQAIAVYYELSKAKQQKGVTRITHLDGSVERLIF